MKAQIKIPDGWGKLPRNAKIKSGDRVLEWYSDDNTGEWLEIMVDKSEGTEVSIKWITSVLNNKVDNFMIIRKGYKNSYTINGNGPFMLG